MHVEKRKVVLLVVRDEHITIVLCQTLPLQGEESLQIVQELSIDIMGNDGNELL